MNLIGSIDSDEIEALERCLAFTEVCADPLNFDHMLTRVCELLNRWAQADVVTLILPPEEEGMEPMLHLFGRQPVLPLAERSIRDDCASLLTELDYAHLPGEALRLRRGAELTPLHGMVRDDHMYRFWSKEMFVHGQSVGIITLYGFVDWILSRRVQRLLDTLSPILAKAIVSAAAVEELRMKSDRDPNTGFLNRQGLWNVLDRECARSEELGRPLSAILLDVEGYEPIAGTEQGEELVIEAADRIASMVGPYDIVARIAPTEFVLILPEKDTFAVKALVNELQSKLDGLSIMGMPAQVDMGVAAFTSGSGERLLQEADSALYNVKRSRVVSSYVG